MNNIEFTVLMCTYKKDDPLLLEKAIESVYNNSIKPKYFILTIDGPIPEKNQKIIKKIKEKFPIKINKIKENIGLAKALNSAILLVKTDWIARADSDDYNSPNRFEIQLKYAQLGFDVIGSNVYEVDNYETRQQTRLRKKMPLNNSQIRNFSRYRNPMNHMTTFYKTEAIRFVGGYPDIYLREDYGLWAKLMFHNKKFVNINEYLVCVSGGDQLYRRRSGFRNAIGEMYLQIYLFKYNIQTFHLALFLFLVRSFIILLPKWFLKFFYINILRKKY